MTSPRVLLTLASGDTITAAVGRRLIELGHFAFAETDAAVDALIVDGVDSVIEIPFLEISDAQFSALYIDATLDRVERLQTGLSRLKHPANILVIGSSHYLGARHRTCQAAASASLVGLVRSLALEYARTPIVINMLAFPGHAGINDATLIDDAAQQASILLNTRSIAGETILLDGGANLKLRQARRPVA